MDIIDRIRGVIPASITAFTAEGKVDEQAMERLIQYYVDCGFCGAFINSSTGEYFSMTPEQREKSVLAAVRAAQSKLVILAGISADNAIEAIEMGKRMALCKADIAVCMPPRFYTYGENELYDYFTHIADSIPIPLIIYNHMTRLNNKMSVDLLLRLSSHPNIIGVKDTHNDAPRLLTLLESLKGRKDFIVYAGGDSMAGFSALMGGYMLNALCVVKPELFNNLQRAGQKGLIGEVMTMQAEVNRLMKLFSLISRPGGSTMSLFYQTVKAVLKLKGICDTHTAHLGFEITEDDLKKIESFLKDF